MSEENSGNEQGIDESAGKGVSTDASQFVPVNIDTLRPNCPFTFDLFVKVNEKFIHYIAKGDDIEEDRLDKVKKIQKLKEKDVDRLFVPILDQDSYESFIDDEIDNAVESEEMTQEEKVDIVAEIAKNAVEVVFDNPGSVLAFKMAEKASGGLRKVVEKDPKVLKNLFKKRARNTDIVEEHCKNVATISLQVAFSLGFRGKDLDNLGTAALVHDIGWSKMKPDDIQMLFRREDKKLSPDDRRLTQFHVEDGLEMLKGKKFINDQILQLVGEHHEKNGGNGFPKRIKKLEPLTEILSLCNYFDKLITAHGLTPTKAFKRIQIQEVGNYDLTLINKLKEALDAEDMFNKSEAELAAEMEAEEGTN